MSTTTARKRATIVGAGQGGLHLAFGLLTDGWDVTVMTDKSPDDYRAGGLLASHTLQQRSVDMEAAAGIDVYAGLTDNRSAGVDFALSLDGSEIAMAFLGDFEGPGGTAIDLRLKYALLLERFAARGGTVVQRAATVADLEELTERGETVFVAAGKGGLSSLFDLDESRTVYDAPQRRLAIAMFDGMDVTRPEQEDRIVFCFRPGLGEIFLGPNVHKDDRGVRTILLEAVPGSPMDRIDEITDAASAATVMRAVVEEFAGWEAGAVAAIRPADERAVLRGALRPCVRRPVGLLPSGRAVFGLGDVTIVNDPVAGQGGNCTTHGVHDLLGALRREDAPALTPDAAGAEWYTAWFDRFWESEGRYFVAFSNLLLEPPAAPAMHILGAATGSRAVADRFAATFADPELLIRHTASIELAEQFVAEAEALAGNGAAGAGTGTHPPAPATAGAGGRAGEQAG